MSTTITTEQIMTLRNQTGAGIMDCKQALKEANGDMQKAIEILRKKGLSGLAKRSGRAMKEGLVLVKSNDKSYVMVEVNCETDFVAKNDEFKNLVNWLCDEMLQNENFDPVKDEKANNKLKEVAMKIGENMQIRRGVRYNKENNCIIGSYVHADNKKGCLIKVRFESNPNDLSKIEELAKNLAMQCVAMGPKWVKREDVPQDVIEKEKEIYKASPQAQGKSEVALTKMLEGRITKFYQEVCLLEQGYIRDNKLTIKAYIENIAKECGTSLSVERFDCFIVGIEG